MHPVLKKALVGLTSSLAFVFTLPAWSQAFPQKPITVVVTQGPGSGSDVMARLLAGYLSPLLGQSVVVENRAGASGIIGHQSVAKAPADGYTLLFTSTAGLFVVPVMNPNAKYSLADYEPVAPVMRAPFAVLVANNTTAPKTMAELISAVKSKPQSFASAGVGTMTHLGSELVMRKAGMQATHIPYKGAGPAVQDLLGGQVDLFFTTPASVVSHIKADKLKGLIVTSNSRLTSLPQVPTSREADLKEFTIDSWFALYAPAGTSPEIVNQINAEIAKILAMPDIKKKAEDAGTMVDHMNPSQLGEYTRKELEYWGRVIQSAKITAE